MEIVPYYSSKMDDPRWPRGRRRSRRKSLRRRRPFTARGSLVLLHLLAGAGSWLSSFYIHADGTETERVISETYCDSIGCGIPRRAANVSLVLTPFQWALQPDLSLVTRAKSDCLRVVGSGIYSMEGTTTLEGEEEEGERFLNATQRARFAARLRAVVRGPGFWSVAVAPTEVLEQSCSRTAAFFLNLYVGGVSAQEGRVATTYFGGAWGEINHKLVANLEECRRTNVDFPLNAELIAPVRRKAFAVGRSGTTVANYPPSDAVFEEEEAQFTPDHLVFGSYGSFWIISLLAKMMPELGMDRCWQLLDEWVGAVSGAGAPATGGNRARQAEQGKRLADIALRVQLACAREAADDRGFGYFAGSSADKELGFYDKYPRVVRRLCAGTNGESMQASGALPRGLQASVLGATLYQDGTVEVAVFVSQKSRGVCSASAGEQVARSRRYRATPLGGGRPDCCVLVDGQRTFSTVPVSYLTPWGCLFKGVSTGAAAVSYSSAVVLVSCQLPRDVLRVGLEEETLYLHARHEGWRVPVCLRQAGAPRPADAAASVEAVQPAEAAGKGTAQLEQDPKEDLEESESFSAQYGAQQRRPRTTARSTTPPGTPPTPPGTHQEHRQASVRRSSSPYRYSFTACSQVLYKLDSPFAHDLLRQWLRYHFKIGVEHFFLYDRDGSVRSFLDTLELDEPGTKTLLDRITYFPAFSHTVLRSAQHHAVHKQHGLPSHAGPDAAAASHCLFLNRGVSEWVFFVHAPDEFLSNTGGLKHVDELLALLRAQNADMLDVSQVSIWEDVLWHKPDNTSGS